MVGVLSGLKFLPVSKITGRPGLE